MVSSRTEAFGTSGELQESAACVLGAVLRVRAGIQVKGDHIIGVVLIEDCASAYFVNRVVPQ
jgi:hypothetical protein